MKKNREGKTEQNYCEKIRTKKPTTSNCTHDPINSVKQKSSRFKDNTEHTDK